MSETEHNKGTLFPIMMIKDVEKSAELILEVIGEKRDVSYTAREQLEEFGYKKYHITDDQIYLVKYESIDGDEDIMEARKSDQGWIEFETKYYNGGCSFSEALDAALDKLAV